MQLANLFVFLFFALLLVFVTNINVVVYQKMELQNSADSIAYSGALWQARGMNAITATNHVIGEMLSFVILHEALGGQRLENRSLGPAESAGHYQDPSHEPGRNLNTINATLDATAAAAQGLGATTPAYETVRQEEGIYADRTILDSKIDLKIWLIRIYSLKVAAKIMQASSVPPVVAAGVMIEQLMNVLEPIIMLEYLLLKDLHAIAELLLPLKSLVRDILCPLAKQYTTLVKLAVPPLAAATARELAEKHGVKGDLVPGLPELPLVIDPFARAFGPVFGPQDYVAAARPTCPCPSVPTDSYRDQCVKTSQLARATWPWVNYHREPILNLLGAIFHFARARHHYFDHSAGAAKYLLDQLQLSDQHDLGLYVMWRYPAPDKGYALWTEDPKMADRLFSVVALAWCPEPPVIGRPVYFGQAHPQGRLALAQAMLYNANEQERAEYRIDMGCKRVHPLRQANVGWDTLNYTSGSRQKQQGCEASRGTTNADADPEENRPLELVGIGIPFEFPRIHVNWQAKLVPLSAQMVQQAQLAPHLDGDIRAVLSRIPGNLHVSLRTH